MKRSGNKTKKEETIPLVQEDAAVYNTIRNNKLTDKEKVILDNLSHSIDFVKKIQQRKN